MRLKEIKPGMVIHCKTQEEANILCDTIGGEPKWKRYWANNREATCYKISNTGFCGYGRTASCNDSNITEFSDLILPELTAEELLNTIKEICSSSNTCNDMCLLCDGNGCVIRKTEFDVKKVIEICSQWKSDHEKKESEIETVDICRIIEIQPNGFKRCVHEEDLASGSTDAEIKILVEAELKRYISNHDGEFIAVHEVVSRVKR